VGPTWADLLERWALIECDLHERFGVDVGDAQLMASRPWPWLRTRITGLLMEDTRLTRAVAPMFQPQP
jgi:hypothetical protein